MKKWMLSAIVACTLCMAAAVAQMTPSGGQGTQGSSPSMQQPGTQPGMGQPDQTAPQTEPSTSAQTGKAEKSEKKLKGCIQSQGGQYVLETKKGKAIALTGQDVSAHVGHEVAVKGNWESGGNAGMSQTSSGGSASAEKTFNVSSVDMISESCGGKKSSSGNAGSSSSTSPSGSTQPPQ
ncbi:MAG TPA: hypothetical protein VFB00_08390 [Terriglobales bacterium]|nr:hypothetical protein [Terriglobales bacterium]